MGLNSNPQLMKKAGCPNMRARYRVRAGAAARAAEKFRAKSGGWAAETRPLKTFNTCVFGTSLGTKRDFSPFFSGWMGQPRMGRQDWHYWRLADFNAKLGCEGQCSNVYLYLRTRFGNKIFREMENLIFWSPFKAVLVLCDKLITSIFQATYVAVFV